MEAKDLMFNDKDTKVLGELLNIEKTSTQSIRVLAIEKSGKKMISVQKWWKKEENQPWKEGKGFHLSFEDSQLIREALEKAESIAEQSEN